MGTKRQSSQRLSRNVRIELRFLERLHERCPNDANVLKAIGDLYTKVGRYEDGLDVDIQLSQLCPDDSEVWYNLGCSYALVGHKERSIQALSTAVELGYRDAEWMKRDEDLDTLKGDPRFESLLARMQQE